LEPNSHDCSRTIRWLSGTASIYWDYFDFDNAFRLLNEGRKKLGDENLYSYEAGAIYENQRNYLPAIAEICKGRSGRGANSPADLRLVELARRPKLRDQVDQQTAKLVTLPNPPIPVVYLRVRVLEAQNRKSEVETSSTQSPIALLHRASRRG